MNNQDSSILGSDQSDESLFLKISSNSTRSNIENEILQAKIQESMKKEKRIDDYLELNNIEKYYPSSLSNLTKSNVKFILNLEKSSIIHKRKISNQIVKN